MDKFITTDLGGIPESWDDLRWFLGQEGNQGIYQALNNIQGAAGTDYVVQGCVLAGTNPAKTLTEGWIVLAGELMKVEAATGIDTSVDSTFVAATPTFDANGNKTLQNTSTTNTYKKNRAELSGTGGTLNVLTGVRLEDQYGAWKEFDLTGKVLQNTASGASDVLNDNALSSGPTIETSFFKYRIIGKTVNFNFRIKDVRLQAYQDSQAKSVIITGLPFTAKNNSSTVVEAVCESHDGAITNRVMANMIATSDRMHFNARLFRPGSIIFNRFYDFDATPSMNVVATSDISTVARWLFQGSGTFEIE